MHPITPHLWFNTQAKEAVKFYTSLFPNSQVDNITTLHNTPSGDADIVSFTLCNKPFMAISAGPYFTFNPAISLFVKLGSLEETNTLWEKLIAGGSALMDIGTYDWSERYGWVKDKYGLTWQLMFNKDIKETSVTPSMLFTKSVFGKAQEAIEFYTKVFPHSNIGFVQKYPPKDPSEGKVMYAECSIMGSECIVMDGPGEHDYTFNEAVSLIVKCNTQKEIDAYWEQLSAVPEAEQCGWLKDKFGVSWQIVPAAMDTFMSSGDQVVIDRVTKAFLPMKKFNIAELEKAVKGE